MLETIIIAPHAIKLNWAALVRVMFRAIGTYPTMVRYWKNPGIACQLLRKRNLKVSPPYYSQSAHIGD
jgi:hypothetical protein